MVLRILTPLWTGDVDQKSELLQSIGIIGSLRWWAEAILRSDNRYACDPTNDKKKCPKEKSYCSACLIFGATGIRRTFRLNVSGGRRVFTGSALNIKPSRRNRGWYLGSGVMGTTNLEIIPLDGDFDESLVLLPLLLASNWGGIGAKTQHGYGVVKIEDCPKIDFNRFRKAIEKITNQQRLSKLRIELRHGSNNGLPDLREMFFAKVQFEITDTDWWKRVDGLSTYVDDPRMIEWISSGSVPVAPAIKNWLRYKEGRKLWETGNKAQDVKIESWLFGTLDKRLCSQCLKQVTRNLKRLGYFWCRNCGISLPENQTINLIKQSSKINVSCAYPVNNVWEFRIWGWIPKNGFSVRFDRDGFLDNLKQTLDGSGPVAVSWDELLGDQTESHKLKVWREFDSSRDTVKSNESDISSYIQSLLEGE